MNVESYDRFRFGYDVSAGDETKKIQLKTYSKPKHTKHIQTNVATKKNFSKI